MKEKPLYKARPPSVKPSSTSQELHPTHEAVRSIMQAFSLSLGRQLGTRLASNKPLEMLEPGKSLIAMHLIFFHTLFSRFLVLHHSFPFHY